MFFGSALRNFGVGDLLEGLGRYAPPPRAQDSNPRKVEAAEPRMTAFVFKIQANMDPNHRDRIAFVRLCSGKLARGMKAKLVRTGKHMCLSSPQFFFAQDRELADEAFAGDVVGIPNHGTLRIGDTLTEGEDLTFLGVPNFAPEILRRVRLKDAMKAKKLKEALQQMAEEGVVQVFRPRDGAPALVGVVGPLQLDVLKARLDAEYPLPVDFEISRIPAGALDFVRRPQEARRLHRRQRLRRSPTTSTAIRCFWPRTNSISATPANAPRASTSPTSRTSRRRRREASLAAGASPSKVANASVTQPCTALTSGSRRRSRCTISQGVRGGSGDGAGTSTNPLLRAVCSTNIAIPAPAMAAVSRARVDPVRIATA